MKKFSDIYYLSRARYQAKRRKKFWVDRKKKNSKFRYIELQRLLKNIRKSKIDHIAPVNFSFIENTQEVLTYFNQLTEFVNEGQPVNLNIKDITNLTPDTIILVIAKLKEKRSKGIILSGNAPDQPDLHKMFLESGLYNFVRSKGTKTVAENNKLWRHSTNNQVRGEMAGHAIEVCKKQFAIKGINYNTDNLYNLLVEAMSNTINHANDKKFQTNWWLYYYIDESNKVIKYSFIDLGIGIFKSASFDTYRNVMNLFFRGNRLLVKPFLEGKIISSRENDNEISGKGVKQIIGCANLSEFVKFIIITNDIKIDVKTKESEDLSINFDGTLIYFEISYN